MVFVSPSEWKHRKQKGQKERLASGRINRRWVRTKFTLSKSLWIFTSELLAVNLRVWIGEKSKLLNLFGFVNESEERQLLKYLLVANYREDETIVQEEIYKVLPNFTYTDCVPARLEGTAETIAEIFTITRESGPTTKRFWDHLCERQRYYLRPSAFSIGIPYPQPLQRLPSSQSLPVSVWEG